MQFEMRNLSLDAKYKIINSTITPRPIAWITSQSNKGLVNCAPYSFFNAVGIEPPIIVLGLLKDPQTRELKDTARNIIENGEFVVNLVTEEDAVKMNKSSASVPSDISEIEYANIATIPSFMVAPPRIATSPVSFECQKLSAIDIGTMQTVILAEILVTHIEDKYVKNPEKLYLDTPDMNLIGRTHGAGWYARGTDQFQLDRHVFNPNWHETNDE